MARRKMLGGSQIEASDAIHDYSCSPCSEDGKNTEGLYHCNVCEMFYCQRCVDGHNRFTKNHNVTDKTSDTFGQTIGKPATSSNDLPTEICEEHHGEVVKMFCPQHDVVCCTVCIAVKHRSCEGVEYIPNIARGLLKKHGKEKTKYSLEKVKAGLKNLKSEMEDHLRNLDRQRDGIIEDIQEFKKRIIARVEELERTSLKEVTARHKELAEDINAYSKEINGLLKVIDTRLNKLTHSTDNNEAQQFVDAKNGEKESCQGADLVKQATSRKKKSMKFEMNGEIDACISKEQSLGSVKECYSVNIVCPVETEITKAFVSELQAKLKTYDIESEYTGLTGIVTGRYTIVLCETDSECEAVQSTLGIKDNTIILMTLKTPWDVFAPPTKRTLQRKFKSEHPIFYVEKKNIQHSITFTAVENYHVYECVSNIVKGLSSCN